MAANSSAMVKETLAERSIDKWIARATTPRGAAVVIATVTTTITVVTGLLMTLIDHDNFPSLGTGLWWAVQTVTTVGYGDRVPESAAGQLLAALVMLLGDRLHHGDHRGHHQHVRLPVELAASGPARGSVGGATGADRGAPRADRSRAARAPVAPSGPHESGYGGDRPSPWEPRGNIGQKTGVNGNRPARRGKRPYAGAFQPLPTPRHPSRRHSGARGRSSNPAAP